ncbi:malto-oligosyltrehalose trehalohydrolase [Castellaniella ginsengisoli]|uniref:Malto-oligosyltrehalose trehalohydrolase n=1 Tax=Castellaniella ginsengisoli TaxID=546114 RepID=A0AB39CHV5_9BURK
MTALAPRTAPCARPLGAFAREDGTTLFRLWAPEAPDGMALVIEGRSPLPAIPDAQGYVEILAAGCPAGTRYGYLLPDGTRIPDPASRLQDGGVHAWSIVAGSTPYPWRHPDWQPRPWEESVIQEVHAGLCGGYAGLCRRLPDLAALGINLIELMPIAAFPGPRNWGYDGVLPYAPDCSYGTPEALKHFIDCAHSLGIGVMLDIVCNHFGPEGNHLPRYASSFFRSDVSTPWGAAIDFRQPAVQRFFEDCAHRWLDEFHIDGLRLDAVHAIFGEAWLHALPGRLRARLPGRRIHLVIEDDANRDSLLESGYDARWNDPLHHVLHHLLTGERQGYYSHYCRHPAQILARCLEGRPPGTPGACLPLASFVSFLQNHDQIGNRARGERLTSLCASAARLRAAIALQLLSPAVPMLFMGEEYGSQTPFLYFTSYRNPRLAKAVRQGRLAVTEPFLDEADRTAGMPEPNAEATFNASKPEACPKTGHAWAAYYTRLLDVRARRLAPRLRGARALQARAIGPAAVQAAWRLGDGSRLSLYVNLGAEACPLPDRPQPAAPDCDALCFETDAAALIRFLQGELAPDCVLCFLESPT